MAIRIMRFGTILIFFYINNLQQDSQIAIKFKHFKILKKRKHFKKTKNFANLSIKFNIKLISLISFCQV